MNLTLEPEIVTWPETHYVFLERTGPFMKTAPDAWTNLHKNVPAIAEKNQITGYMSLYKTGPQIYRAGVAVSAPPVDLPEGIHYEKFSGGKYSRFVLTGSFSQLPEASCKVWTIAEEKPIAQRDDFAIEHYTNDPRITPEEQLVTEILVPTV